MIQQKTREDREQELIAMMWSAEGRAQIIRTYNKAKGIPNGIGPQPGTSWREEMIPAILDFEFPLAVA